MTKNWAQNYIQYNLIYVKKKKKKNKTKKTGREEAKI